MTRLFNDMLKEFIQGYYLRTKIAQSKPVNMPKPKSFINKKSEVFLEKYLNNPSPTGFESEGQKIWLEYIKPYIDDTIIDTYGTAVGVINPSAK